MIHRGLSWGAVKGICGEKKRGLMEDATFLLTVGSFLPTVELYLQLTILAFLLTSRAFFTYNFCFFTHNWSFFAYSGKVLLISALRDYKQRSLTVSKKAPTASKKLQLQVKKLPPPPGQSTEDKETRGEESAGGTVRGSKWA